MEKTLGFGVNVHRSNNEEEEEEESFIVRCLSF